MSTRGNKLVSEIQERYLECNICTEIFNEHGRIPKLLPCLHTFCLACLKALYKFDRIKCPTCNGWYKLSKQEFNDLPKDNTRRDLSSFIQVKRSPDNECSYCGKCVNELFCCYDCDICFCSKCCKVHKQQNSSHNVQGLNEETSDVCKIAGHDNSPLKYFCNGPLCKKVICANCALSDHRDQGKHYLEDVRQTIDQRKDKLRTSVTALRKQINTVKSIEKKCQEKDISLRKEREKFCTNVERIYNVGVKALKSKKELIIQSYNKTLEEHKDCIVRTKEKTFTYIMNAEECCRITERLLSDCGIKSFLAVDKTLNSRIQEFVDKSFENVEYNDIAGLQSLHGQVTSFEQSVKDSLKTTKSGCVYGSEFIKYILKKHCLCLEPTTILQSGIKTAKKVRAYLYDRCFSETVPEPIVDEQKLRSIFPTLLLILIVISILPAQLFISSNHFGNTTFNTTQESSFACRSFDNKTVSTIPDFYRLTCGSKDTFFKYKGVFLDRKFRIYKFHQVDINVKFQDHFMVNDYYMFESLVLFEFDITTGSVQTKYLTDTSSIVTLSASSCRIRNKYSVCLFIGRNGWKKVKLMDNVFVADENTDYIEVKFSIQIRPERGIISLISRTVDNILLYKTEYVARNSSLFGVFAMHEQEKISASISLSPGDNIQFDRSTLYPGLYISSDNKTVSNRPTSNTNLYERKDNRYVYAVPMSVASINDIYSIVNIKFTHMGSLKNGTKLFEIGLGRYKKRQFVEDFKFECIMCRVARTSKDRYCLLSRDGLSVIEADFRIVMHYQIEKKRLSLYIPETVEKRRYDIYTNKNFNRVLPTFYIRKLDSTDVTASLTNDIRLYEVAVISFLDWFNSLIINFF